MILVTGAAGKTGQAVVQRLAAVEEPVRVLVHRPEQVEELRALGAAEFIVGDMRVEAVMRDAMTGVRAVYHIAPNMTDDEVTMGRAAIDSARSSGVQRFVFHSVLHPQTEKMPHHWHKLLVEEMLLESTLPFTILQPAAYMQNVLPYWANMAETGRYRVPYAADAKLSLVDLVDVAEAAMKALIESGHEAATYELAGPAALSADEIAAIVGRELGRPVSAETISVEQWQREACTSGLSESKIEALAKMFRYYNRFGLPGNPRILGGLLGRAPTEFSTFVERATDVMGASS
jgi:uncharacterized protein YbjT (DUF2867 family)